MWSIYFDISLLLQQAHRTTTESQLWSMKVGFHGALRWQTASSLLLLRQHRLLHPLHPLPPRSSYSTLALLPLFSLLLLQHEEMDWPALVSSQGQSQGFRSFQIHQRGATPTPSGRGKQGPWSSCRTRLHHCSLMLTVPLLLTHFTPPHTPPHTRFTPRHTHLRYLCTALAPPLATHLCRDVGEEQ